MSVLLPKQKSQQNVNSVKFLPELHDSWNHKIMTNNDNFNRKKPFSASLNFHYLYPFKGDYANNKEIVQTVMTALCIFDIIITRKKGSIRWDYSVTHLALPKPYLAIKEKLFPVSEIKIREIYWEGRLRGKKCVTKKEIHKSINKTTKSTRVASNSSALVSQSELLPSVLHTKWKSGERSCAAGEASTECFAANVSAIVNCLVGFNRR